MKLYCLLLLCIGNCGMATAQERKHDALVYKPGVQEFEWKNKYACNYFNSYDIGRVNIHASFSNQGFRVVRK